MGNLQEYGSLLEYYQRHTFNPVPIAVEDHQAWNTHYGKRRNLYERHLGIPFSLINGRSVIEFGPNSGENALVLALAGARLTLVEPNAQVLPRLHALFERFGLLGSIEALEVQQIEEFQPAQPYDLVIAEGFLCTLSSRDTLLRKLADLLKPNALGVISYNCRFGGLVELIKCHILRRVCRLRGHALDGEESCALATTLFGEDFAKLNASRPLKAWWMDNLVNPFYSGAYLWSLPEILPLLENAGCRFLSSSPKWSLTDHFQWYKNAPDTSAIHQDVLMDWHKAFPYLLTGRRPRLLEPAPAVAETISDIAALVTTMSEEAKDEFYLCSHSPSRYPGSLDQSLCESGDPRLQELNVDLQNVFDALASNDVDALVSTYRGALQLRSTWGTPYQYLSFIKT